MICLCVGAGRRVDRCPGQDDDTNRAALDAGISWFDTAPLYAQGAAESVLGRALAGRRDRVTIVSKVGILPTRITRAHRLHALAWRLAKPIPGAKALVPPLPVLHPEFGVFDPLRVRRSVEKSLRALRTDYLDALLLHECALDDATDQALLRTLDDLQSEGKIRAYGSATNTPLTAMLMADTKCTFSVFQYAASFWDRHEVTPAGSSRMSVIHSVFGSKLQGFLHRLATDETVRADARRLDIDPDGGDLPQRLLAYAMQSNKNGVILFSTQNAARIGDAAASFGVSHEDAAAGMKLIRSAPVG